MSTWNGLFAKTQCYMEGFVQEHLVIFKPLAEKNALVTLFFLQPRCNYDAHTLSKQVSFPDFRVECELSTEPLPHTANCVHYINIMWLRNKIRERSGSVVECLTRDRRAAGSSLTGVTALWSLSKTHLS